MWSLSPWWGASLIYKHVHKVRVYLCWERQVDGTSFRMISGYYPLKVPKSDFFPHLLKMCSIYLCLDKLFFWNKKFRFSSPRNTFRHGMVFASVRWEVIPWLARNDAWRIGWTRRYLRSCWCKRLFLTEKFGNKVITCEKRNMWLLPVFFQEVGHTIPFYVGNNWEYTSLSVHDPW